jgi:WD40 repeat protein
LDEVQNSSIAVFDYYTSHLLHVFQTDKEISTIFSSPLVQDVIFWVTEKLAVYKLDNQDLTGTGQFKKSYKLKSSKDFHVNEFQIHPQLTLLFAACDDSMIRVFDYWSGNEYPAFKLPESQKWAITSLDFTFNGDFLLSGEDQGSVMIWDSSSLASSEDRYLANSLRTTMFPIVASKWFRYKPFADNYCFVSLVQDGTAQLYQFQFVDPNAK